MSAADAIKALIEPLAPGWRIQLGRWVDGDKTDSFIVIRPVGGVGAELVRRPQFSLMVIGADGAPLQSPQDIADAIVEAMRTDSGSLVHMQAGEPVFMATTGGRPVFEIAVSAITV